MHLQLLSFRMKNLLWKLKGKLKKSVTSSKHYHCGDSSCHQKGKCSCYVPDVPHGFFAVYAGRERKRYVIPTSYLNHPAFFLLLEKAKEEFGFSQKGGLNMPFEVLLFERLLWLLDHGELSPPFHLDIQELEQYYIEKYRLCIEPIHLDVVDDDECCS